jgi:hypothetical protein
VSQSLFTLRQTRLAVSLPIAPPKKRAQRATDPARNRSGHDRRSTNERQC